MLKTRGGVYTLTESANKCESPDCCDPTETYPYKTPKESCVHSAAGAKVRQTGSAEEGGEALGLDVAINRGLGFFLQTSRL